MERNEVSIHEVKVFLCMSKTTGWKTNDEISKLSGICRRTTRAHTMRLVQLGILDQAEVFPAHKYRFSTKAAVRNKTYMQRIEQAVDVFGLKEDV